MSQIADRLLVLIHGGAAAEFMPSVRPTLSDDSRLVVRLVTAG